MFAASCIYTAVKPKQVPPLSLSPGPSVPTCLPLGTGWNTRQAGHGPALLCAGTADAVPRSSASALAGTQPVGQLTCIKPPLLPRLIRGTGRRCLNSAVLWVQLGLKKPTSNSPCMCHQSPSSPAPSLIFVKCSLPSKGKKKQTTHPGAYIPNTIKKSLEGETTIPTWDFTTAAQDQTNPGDKVTFTKGRKTCWSTHH